MTHANCGICTSGILTALLIVASCVAPPQFFHEQAHICNFPKLQLPFTNPNFFLHLKKCEAGTKSTIYTRLKFYILVIVLSTKALGAIEVNISKIKSRFGLIPHHLPKNPVIFISYCKIVKKNRIANTSQRFFVIISSLSGGFLSLAINARIVRSGQNMTIIKSLFSVNCGDGMPIGAPDGNHT